MRLALVLIAWSCASLATACSICSGLISSRATFGEEMDSAAVVVFGTLSNPRLNADANAPGAGSTDLTIERFLKNDGSLGDVKRMTLSRYLPVPDPKQPPRFLVFLEKFRDRLEPVRGVAMKTPALPLYLEGARAARAKGRIPALLYYATFLNHADDEVATDALVEFAKSKDAEVAAAGTMLDPALPRRLLANKNLDSDRLSLFAFLLGCSGQDSDADILLRLANGLTGDQKSALDGILAAYATLRPADGWKKINSILADKNEPFPTRFSAIRTVRVLHGWKGDAIKPHALAAYKHVVADGELADLGVEDLRKWKWWELTTDITEHFDRPTHKAPIVRHCFIRYALSCPRPEVKTLLARARQIEPEYVEDQEKLLAETTGR